MHVSEVVQDEARHGFEAARQRDAFPLGKEQRVSSDAASDEQARDGLVLPRWSVRSITALVAP